MRGERLRGSAPGGDIALGLAVYDLAMDSARIPTVSQPKSKDEYRTAVLAQVEADDWVTFAALHKRLAGDSREPTEIVLPGNRVIWTGMPREPGLPADLRGSRDAYELERHRGEACDIG